jgi:AraC-like DNA-binding protein
MTRHPRHRCTTALWRDDSLAGAEWLRGTFSDFSYAPHAHDAHCLAVITRGAIRIRARGSELVARAGDVFAANVGEMHAGWPIDEQGWSLRSVYLDLARLQSLVNGGVRAPAATMSGPFITDRDLATRLVAAHEGSEGAVSALRRDEAFIDFAGCLVERYVRPSPRDETVDCAPGAVRRAREFLDAHLDTRVSLRDLADVADLPPTRLLRAFARAVGVSPHVYQRQARLRYGTRLIREGRSLSEAAAAAGFADQPHFTRLFHRTMGLPPGAYQRAWAWPRSKCSPRTAPPRAERGE